MHDNLHARPCSGPEPRQETELESLVKIEERIDPQAREFYRKAISAVRAAGVPLLVGGAFGFEFYTGISRYTKDVDLFVCARDAPQVLDVLASAGYETEVTAPHWLVKACSGDTYVDFIFGQANGASVVDEEWFQNPVRQIILGMELELCPVEEMICSKAFVMDRNRYDGADVAHLLRERAEQVDWDRLLRRFGENWHVLLSHLLLFTFIYPSESGRIPARIMDELIGRLSRELRNPASEDRICRGTLLSMTQYHIDILRWGYRDARQFKQTVGRLKKAS
jgi:hypothetical protein